MDKLKFKYKKRRSKIYWELLHSDASKLVLKGRIDASVDHVFFHTGIKKNMSEWKFYTECFVSDVLDGILEVVGFLFSDYYIDNIPEFEVFIKDAIFEGVVKYFKEELKNL